MIIFPYILVALVFPLCVSGNLKCTNFKFRANGNLPISIGVVKSTITNKVVICATNSQIFNAIAFVYNAESRSCVSLLSQKGLIPLQQDADSKFYIKDGISIDIIMIDNTVSSHNGLKVFLPLTKTWYSKNVHKNMKYALTKTSTRHFESFGATGAKLMKFRDVDNPIVVKTTKDYPKGLTYAFWVKSKKKKSMAIIDAVKPNVFYYFADIRKNLAPYDGDKVFKHDVGMDLGKWVYSTVKFDLVNKVVKLWRNGEFVERWNISAYNVNNTDARTISIGRRLPDEYILIGGIGCVYILDNDDVMNDGNLAKKLRDSCP